MYGTKVIDILCKNNISNIYYDNAIDFIKTPVIYGPLNYKNFSYMKLLYWIYYERGGPGVQTLGV